MRRKALFSIVVFIFVSATVRTSVAQTCVQCPPGPVGWWPFDGNAEDRLGSHPGTLHGAPSFAAGLVGQAIDLDGVDDFVEVLNTPDLNPSQQITVGAWYRPVSFEGNGNNAIIDKGYFAHVPPYYQYHLGVSGDLYWHDTSGFSFDVSLDGVATSVFSGSVWFPGNWYFVVGTYDGSMLRLYVNGNLVASQAATGTMTDYGQNVRIGAFDNIVNSTYYTPGRIDEVFVAARALTECEISSIYAAGVAGMCKGDSDGDGVPDIGDSCPYVPNPGQQNQDGDLAGDECDCAPTDPGVFAMPMEVGGLRVGDGGNKSLLSWCPPATSTGPSTVFNVTRGLVNELPVGSGFSETCLPPGSLLNPNAIDATDPSGGKSYWYLVRGRNACGIGTYGFRSDGVERLTTACP